MLPWSLNTDSCISGYVSRKPLMIGHVQVLKSLLILKLWLSYGIRGQQWLFYFILVWQVFGLMNQRISQTERRTVAEAMQNQSFDDHGHTRREASQWWLFEYFPALECCTRGYPVNRPRDVWMTSSNGLSKWRCLVTELASPRNSDNLIPLLNLGEKWKKKLPTDPNHPSLYLRTRKKVLSRA